MGEKREIIYVKADRNIEVTKPEVTVGDVLKIECTNTKILLRIRNLRLLKFQNSEDKNKDRIAVSILKVISLIHEVYPDIEVQNLGEADFIVTYEKQKTTGGMNLITGDNRRTVMHRRFVEKDIFQ